MPLRLSLAARATAAAPANEIAAEGTIENAGNDPVEIDLVHLSSSLALDVVSADGESVRMLPPPTPGRPQMIVLGPGDRRLVIFRAFLPSDASTGRYRVRFRYRDARSPWVEIAVG